MKLKQIKKQKGFTMIELVIVIAILGILAAFALPRFANFSTNATTASSQSIRGTIIASAGILKSKYIADGTNATTMNYNGYSVPVLSNGDIDFDVAALTNESCANLMTALISNAQGLTFEKYNGVASTCLIRRSNGAFSNGLSYIAFSKNGAS